MTLPFNYAMPINGALKALTCRWRHALALLAALCFALPALTHAQQLPGPDANNGKTFRVLTFHDVREGVRASFSKDPEETAIDQTTLVGVFAWLQQNNYRAVSLQQIIDARAGGPPLPPQAVLLSFDDGYASFYTKVFPLLRSYKYPAVMALVTSWMEMPADGKVPYGDILLARDRFITWAQAREMSQSGLVELISHSDAMHQGIPGNPQGNVLPAATTHRYDAATGLYESTAAYLARVEADLRRSREIIERRTGAKVRALAWPYGAYNAPAVAAAARAGLPYTFSLDDGVNDASVPLATIRRGLVTYNLEGPDYLHMLRSVAGTQDGSGQPRAVNRVMHVDLDYVYDPDPKQQEANLSMLLERVLAVGPTSVFLQAYSDPDGDGVADALYFPNRHLPMRADLFNRVAWQLRTRTHVRVYAWMPVMAFSLPASHPLATRLVTSLAANNTAYRRLSPFDSEVRALIGDIYEDLTRHASFAGLLFHDDATLSDHEDASPAALHTYATWGLPPDLHAIRADPALMARWTAGKTRFLTDFTLELANRVRVWQPTLLTARNVYARPLLESQAEAWFAQNYEQSLTSYDYTAVMAMPYMENVADPHAWLTALVRRAAKVPLGLDKTVFELQAKDWRTGEPVPDAELTRQWQLMRRAGARNLGYYPDDFLNNQPSMEVVRNALSTRTKLLGAVVLPSSLVPPVTSAPAPMQKGSPP